MSGYAQQQKDRHRDETASARNSIDKACNKENNKADEYDGKRDVHDSDRGSVFVMKKLCSSGIIKT